MIKGNKKTMIIVPFVGGLGTISTKITKWIEKLGVNVKIKYLHERVLFGTARILYRVLKI